ncbi:MAG: phosphoribosylglycinamide formyltransferase [Clostridiales bacterium]|jgi:phosphoribosylglycinamide formyltransferase-1|nr:phosphoribosylglycinamide formyltransferase [Clostridiales bacterium]
MLNVGVLVSGGGTNLQALIDAERAGTLGPARVVCAVSSRTDAPALERARLAGIDAVFIGRKDYADTAAYEMAMADYLKSRGVKLVVLAGFLTILTEGFIDVFNGCVINVHPALIPAFSGKGFYGLKVHERVLASGAEVTGATVHMVSSEPDAGPIILQKRVAVLPGDTPEILQRRVMEEAEWVILPQAVRMIAEGD